MSSRNEGRLAEEMERTLYVSNLDDRATDEILYELMIQAGPVEGVTRLKDRPYAFVTFEHEESVPYAIAVFRGVRLFNRSLDMKPREGTQQARKIHMFMEEVQDRRHRAMNPRDAGGRFSGGHSFPAKNIPPLFSGPPHLFSSSQDLFSNRATSFGYGPPANFHDQRSFSWPKSPYGAPFLPPPPPPPPMAPPDHSFPKNERRSRRDYDEDRRYDDRGRPGSRSRDRDNRGNDDRRGYR